MTKKFHALDLIATKKRVLKRTVTSCRLQVARTVLDVSRNKNKIQAINLNLVSFVFIS